MLTRTHACVFLLLKTLPRPHSTRLTPSHAPSTRGCRELGCAPGERLETGLPCHAGPEVSLSVLRCPPSRACRLLQPRVTQRLWGWQPHGGGDVWRSLGGPDCLGVSPGPLRPEPGPGLRLCGGGHARSPPGRAQEAHGYSLPGAWALANRQRRRLLGRLYFKQSRALSGNMCLLLSPLLLSHFCLKYHSLGGPPFLCFSLSCRFSLCLCLFLSLDFTVSPSLSGVTVGTRLMPLGV